MTRSVRVVANLRAAWRTASECLRVYPPTATVSWPSPTNPLRRLAPRCPCARRLGPQVKQLFYRCAGKKAKEERLGDILTQVPVGQCIVFVHTREAVDTLTKLLSANGHTVSSLHGRMEEKVSSLADRTRRTPPPISRPP